MANPCGKLRYRDTSADAFRNLIRDWRRFPSLGAPSSHLRNRINKALKLTDFTRPHGGRGRERENGGRRRDSREERSFADNPIFVGARVWCACRQKQHVLGVSASDHDQCIRRRGAPAAGGPCQRQLDGDPRTEMAALRTWGLNRSIGGGHA